MFLTDVHVQITLIEPSITFYLMFLALTGKFKVCFNDNIMLILPS